MKISVFVFSKIWFCISAKWNGYTKEWGEDGGVVSVLNFIAV